MISLKQPITVPLKPHLLPIINLAFLFIVVKMQGRLIPIKLAVDRDKNSQLDPIDRQEPVADKIVVFPTNFTPLPA